jgi:hypothetical protein
MLAALDRLEQKRFARAADFAVGRERRFNVSEQAARDGNHVALRGELQKFIRRRRIHEIIFSRSAGKTKAGSRSFEFGSVGFSNLVNSEFHPEMSLAFGQKPVIFFCSRSEKFQRGQFNLFLFYGHSKRSSPGHGDQLQRRHFRRPRFPAPHARQPARVRAGHAA